MRAATDFEQAFGVSHFNTGAGKGERGGIESTVCVDPYQPRAPGAERADVDFRRVAWCTERQRVVKPRATAVAGAVQEHEKPAVAARDEHVDSPVVVDVGAQGARYRHRDVGCGDLSHALNPSVRPGAASHAEGQAQRAVATQCEQLVGSISREGADGCRDHIVAEANVGLRVPHPFSEGRCALD